MSKTSRPSAPDDSARRTALVSCWMCGVCMHASQMMPDGGSACDDIRWYCIDARACTERWTTSRHTLAQSSAGKKDGETVTETRFEGPADLVTPAGTGSSSVR